MARKISSSFHLSVETSDQTLFNEAKEVLAERLVPVDCIGAVAMDRAVSKPAYDAGIIVAGRVDACESPSPNGALRGLAP
ncbi:MAG: hypothetical protein ACHRXM_04960 [Isosphaerales bacterium]